MKKIKSIKSESVNLLKRRRFWNIATPPLIAFAIVTVALSYVISHEMEQLRNSSSERVIVKEIIYDDGHIETQTETAKITEDDHPHNQGTFPVSTQEQYSMKAEPTKSGTYTPQETNDDIYWTQPTSTQYDVPQQENDTPKSENKQGSTPTTDVKQGTSTEENLPGDQNGETPGAAPSISPTYPAQGSDQENLKNDNMPAK